MKTPSLSVIVPFYNTAAYLDRCLASLASECERDPRIEVVLIDDGSDDASGTIARGYVERMPQRMRLVSQSNRGQSAATNRGIETARGEYIGFADSDDWIDPGMYSDMLDYAIDTGAEMVICDFKKVFPDGSKKKFRYIDTGKDGVDPQKVHEVLFSVGNSPWNKVVRRDIFFRHELFFPEGIIFQDLVLFVLMVSKLHKIVNIGQPFYNYRVRENSLIHSWNDNVYDIFKAIALISQRLDPKFNDAFEYLVIRELFFSHLPRYIDISDERFDHYFKACIGFFDRRFPDGVRNRYLRSDSFWRKAYVTAVLRGWKWPVRWLKRLKRMMHY